MTCNAFDSAIWRGVRARTKLRLDTTFYKYTRVVPTHPKDLHVPRHAAQTLYNLHFDTSLVLFRLPLIPTFYTKATFVIDSMGNTGAARFSFEYFFTHSRLAALPFWLLLSKLATPF